MNRPPSLRAALLTADPVPVYMDAFFIVLRPRLGGLVAVPQMEQGQGDDVLFQAQDLPYLPHRRLHREQSAPAGRDPKGRRAQQDVFDRRGAVLDPKIILPVRNRPAVIAGHDDHQGRVHV